MDMCRKYVSIKVSGFDLASFDFQKDISHVVTSHVANQIGKV